MLKRIRSKIKEISAIHHYAEKVDMTSSNLYNFLNGKLDVRVSTLIKIIKPLGMDILESLPDQLEEVATVVVKGKTYKKSEKYKGLEILLCFGSGSTSHQCILVKAENGKMELKIF